jgi:hypothetical protein
MSAPGAEDAAIRMTPVEPRIADLLSPVGRVEGSRP